MLAPKHYQFATRCYCCNTLHTLPLSTPAADFTRETTPSKPDASSPPATAHGFTASTLAWGAAYTSGADPAAAMQHAQLAILLKTREKQTSAAAAEEPKRLSVIAKMLQEHPVLSLRCRSSVNTNAKGDGMKGHSGWVVAQVERSTHTNTQVDGR